MALDFLPSRKGGNELFDFRTARYDGLSAFAPAWQRVVAAVAASELILAILFLIGFVGTVRLGVFAALFGALGLALAFLRGQTVLAGAFRELSNGRRIGAYSFVSWVAVPLLPMAASALVPHEADVVSGMSLTLLETFWVGVLWDWVWELLDNLFLALLAGGPHSVLANTYGLRIWLHKMLGFPWEHIVQVSLDDQGAADITVRSGDAKRVRSEIERLDFVRTAHVAGPGGRTPGA